MPIAVSNGANPDAPLVAVTVPDALTFDRIKEVWHEVKKHAMIALVFDKSGSMAGEKLTAAITGAKSFVGTMDRQDWLVWMPFDDKVYPGAQGLKSQVGERLVSEIASTAAGSGTALYDAVAQAYRLLETERKTRGDTVRYGIIILSDGKDTSSSQATLVILEAMLKPSEGDPTGIQIHTIGIGADADKAILARIATSAHGRYWDATNPASVETTYREIAVHY
jgi:Ca-activated chloride channel family protein